MHSVPNSILRKYKNKNKMETQLQFKNCSQEAMIVVFTHEIQHKLY
jgi:hypothetical protein